MVSSPWVGSRAIWRRLWRLEPERPVRHPLVLIHGMSSSPLAWDPVLPLLSGWREVHVLALPGHRGGRPLAHPGELAMMDYVDEIEREMNLLGLDKADLVGNSLGGWVALQLAGRGRANSVVCLAPAGGWPVGGPFDKFVTTQFALGHRACKRLVSPRGKRFMRSARVRRAVLKAMVAKPEMISDRQFDDIVHDVADCQALRYAVGRPAARDVSSVPRADCPVLIAWSQHDRVLISRAARRRLESQVGDPEVTVLRGVGHVPMSDDPALVAEVILRFTAAADDVSMAESQTNGHATDMSSPSPP
ncbi:MAG: alpha/beta fold hydrolase [Marmoricola sp.]